MYYRVVVDVWCARILSSNFLFPPAWQHVILLHRASDQVPAIAKLSSLIELKVSTLARKCVRIGSGFSGSVDASGNVFHVMFALQCQSSVLAGRPQRRWRHSSASDDMI